VSVQIHSPIALPPGTDGRHPLNRNPDCARIGLVALGGGGRGELVYAENRNTIPCLFSPHSNHSSDCSAGLFLQLLNSL
jgi:hypothetical protein